MKRLAVILAATAVALAGCAASPGSSPTQPEEPRDSESSAVGLVGLWKVDADGADDATWLRLDANEAHLWTECGVLMGSWTASETVFLAQIHGSVGCSAIPTVEWLEDTVGYRASVDGWSLVDAQGNATANLTIDGQPQPHPDLIADYAKPPVLSDEDRARFEAAPSLTGDVEPAAAASLEGRWVPAESTPTDPFIAFSADGTWEGSDGCNGNGGRWAAGERGELLATTGPSTLIYCEGMAVGHIMHEVRLAGFDGDTLVLFDADGAVLGELVRG